MSERRVGDYMYDKDKESDVLGAGNYGTVFLGWHFQCKNRKVAIKLINLRKSAVKVMGAEMIGREIDILKDLASTPHPNLVTLLHPEVTDRKIFFVMEYCNGKDLRKYLKASNGVLRESIIRLFFHQIASGMKFLHDKGIIHRDLKPENILLNFDGDPYPEPENIVVKIADFGLGRYLPEDGCATTICGSPNYMAPEIKPGQKYDKKVDTWSVGVMIYECLVGSFNAQELKEIKFPENASTNIKDVLKHLLIRQPNLRYDFDQLLNHSFMNENMHLRVQSSGSLAKTITVKKSSFVRALIEKVRYEFDINTESENIRLFTTDAPDLELNWGSNLSLEDSGISSGSSVTLVYRLPGGKHSLRT